MPKSKHRKNHKEKLSKFKNKISKGRELLEHQYRKMMEEQYRKMMEEEMKNQSAETSQEPKIEGAEEFNIDNQVEDIQIPEIISNDQPSEINSSGSDGVVNPM